VVVELLVMPLKTAHVAVLVMHCESVYVSAEPFVDAVQVTPRVVGPLVVNDGVPGVPGGGGLTSKILSSQWVAEPAA
jgi:hypothetical protein